MTSPGHPNRAAEATIGTLYLDPAGSEKRCHRRDNRHPRTTPPDLLTRRPEATV